MGVFYTTTVIVGMTIPKSWYVEEYEYMSPAACDHGYDSSFCPRCGKPAPKKKTGRRTPGHVLKAFGFQDEDDLFDALDNEVVKLSGYLDVIRVDDNHGNETIVVGRVLTTISDPRPEGEFHKTIPGPLNVPSRSEIVVSLEAAGIPFEPQSYGTHVIVAGR